MLDIYNFGWIFFFDDNEMVEEDYYKATDKKPFVHEGWICGEILH